VDDFLASFEEEKRHDALLDGLLVRESTVQLAPALEAAARDSARRSDGVETNRRLLLEVGKRATDSGVLPWRRKVLAEATRRSTSAVDRAQRRLVDRGHLELLAEAAHHFTDGTYWTEPARYLLAPELRPPVVKKSLRQWLAERS
jgi:hypothetical protein